MAGALPVRLRLNAGQIALKSMRAGALAMGVLIIPVVLHILINGEFLPGVLSLLAGFLVSAVVCALWVKGDGVDVDENGIHPVMSGRPRREYAPWHLITDIRAERRGHRTVPVVYFMSGSVWRLRVPYDGVGLGSDPDFDEKLATVRNMWEIYHSWQRI